MFETSMVADFPTEIASSVLNAPMFMLRRYDCDALYTPAHKPECFDSMALHQSLDTVNNAVIELIASLNITQAVIVYDSKCLLVSPAFHPSSY